MKDIGIAKPSDGSVLFEIIGAGFLEISEYCNAQCEGAKGFSIAVSWGKYGYAGGLLPIEAAKELAELILKSIVAENLKPEYDKYPDSYPGS